MILGLICGTLLMWLGLEPIDAGLVALLIWTYTWFLIDDEDIL